MKKILIALDYNSTAPKVAETGYYMAKAMKAEVTLLHVIADPIYYSSLEYSAITGYGGYIDLSKMELDSMNGLTTSIQHFLDRYKLHLGDDSIKTLIREGDTAQAILNAAKELHADVVVLGSHSRRWLEEILMGSITEQVLHHTTVPLFIVPTKHKK